MVVLQQVPTGDMKQITTDNIYEHTSQQWHKHQSVQRLNCHPQMGHTVSGFTI
jgi:hypothetical protein